ncbi:MAG: DNA internalization-related competence protein ComEC/Rec2 [Gemmatimonadota bacterium]
MVGFPWLFAGLTVVLLVAGIEAARAPRFPLALVGLLCVVGVASGATAGSRSRSSCQASLSGGRPVIAVGSLQDRVPRLVAGSGASRARVSLAGTTIVADGRLCDLGAVRITLPLADRPRGAGDRVLVKGVWRRSGEGRLPRSIDRYGVLSATSVEPVGSGKGNAGPGVRLRATLARRLEERLPTSDIAAVGKALLLADKTTLSREVRQRFIDAGVVHLLAISGLHVGMIAGSIVWVIGVVERRPRRWIWAAIMVTGYVVMIGAPPAATRAALVFWGHAYCRWRDRPARISDLAGAAALVAIAGDPLLVTDPGFQLSFAGFAGVIVGHRVGARVADGIRSRGPGAESRSAQWRRRIATLTDGLVSSAGAFALTAPIAAMHFGRVVATSIPASLASTGLVALAIPAVAATALLPDPLGSLAGSAAGALLVALTGVADAFAGVPLRWRVTATTGWFWVLCAPLVAGLIRARRTHRVGYGLALALTLTAVVVRPTAVRLAGRGTPLLCQLDVGQGDATVVRTGAGRWLVFDSGPGTSIMEGRAAGSQELRVGLGRSDAGRDVIVPFLRAQGAREIELLVLSHPHLDHFGGSGALFERFRVRNVLDPGVPQPSVAYLSFLERVDDERAVWVRGTAGDVLAIDDLELRILWPGPEPGTDANKTSLSFRLELGALSYVNTGDAPAEAERAILGRVEPGLLRADLLKLGHHGSKTSSSMAWLRAVNPEIAVMSLSRDNRYGHPHAITLARLDSAHIRQVWRTDRDGSLCIEVTADGWRIVSAP